MMERAKELFLKYNGNRFYMALNGDEYEYDRYQVSRETEETWRREYLDKFLQQKQYGKDALKAYASAVGFLKSDRSDADWENFLYYPLRSRWLDDVTVLFMLPLSFMLAEKWTNKGRFSKIEAEEYLKTMDIFLKEVQNRSETGTLTRGEDYNRNEFSDPAYVATYIDDLQRKWLKLK